MATTFTPELVQRMIDESGPLANDRSCKVRGLTNTLVRLSEDWLKKQAVLDSQLKTQAALAGQPKIG